MGCLDCPPSIIGYTDNDALFLYAHMVIIARVVVRHWKRQQRLLMYVDGIRRARVKVKGIRFLFARTDVRPARGLSHCLRGGLLGCDPDTSLEMINRH